MKRFLLALPLLLGGCASFENIPVCSPDGSEAFVLSKYANLIGIGTNIAPRYTPFICKKPPNA